MSNDVQRLYKVAKQKKRSERLEIITMKKVAVIGHYAYGLEYLDGQTIKTKIITNELCKEYGKSEVLQFDTHGRVKTLFKAPLYVWRAMKNAQNIVILPAHNGLRIFGRLLPAFKMFFKSRKIHYVVIGGWLSNVLEKQKSLARTLKKFDGIYVETQTMKRALEAKEFENVFVMPNCKELTPLSGSCFAHQSEVPYKLCTFSRVMKEKGIEAAICAVEAVNKEAGRTVFELSIYGPIDSGQKEWFDDVRKRMTGAVSYKGVVPYDGTVEVLKDYFALLFPTEFFTEGVPGTIIDAYAAGVPVICSKWESCSDIVDNGVTGICYEFGNTAALESVLRDISENPNKIVEMKMNCLAKAECFMPENAIRVLLEKIE